MITHQMDHRRSLKERFRYQNTMSHGTTQERATLMLKLRNHERAPEYGRVQAIQRQAEEQRQQQEQAQQLKLIKEQERMLQHEQSRKQTVSPSRGVG